MSRRTTQQQPSSRPKYHRFQLSSHPELLVPIKDQSHFSLLLPYQNHVRVHYLVGHEHFTIYNNTGETKRIYFRNELGSTQIKVSGGELQQHDY